MNFGVLVKSIAEIHHRLQVGAAGAVNRALTCRNWLIGAYIHEYELKGEDRATYGERLFEQLAARLKQLGIPNCDKSRLYRYRDFYRFYPQLAEELPGEVLGLPIGCENAFKKVATVSPQSSSEAVQAEPKHIVWDPYVFEFLGLRPQEVLPESDLESALLTRLELQGSSGKCVVGRVAS